MAESSQGICARLSAVPGIMTVPVPELDLFILRDFLDDRECGELVRLIDSDLRPSRLFADNPDPDFRTSRTCNLDRQDGLVRAVEARIAGLLGIAPEKGEFLQGQRYQAGQQFKPHHDYLRPGQPYWERQKDIGGQRTWTAMIFLNRPESGGETYFPRVDLTIVPRSGSIVIWNNLDRQGEPNSSTLHAGLPVLSGEKHIVTKWFRERPWGKPLQPKKA